MNAVIFIAIVAFAFWIYGKAKQRQGELEEKNEALYNAEVRTIDMLKEEEKIRLLNHLEKMEPSDAFALLRDGGVLPKDRKSSEDPSLCSDADTPSDGDTKDGG